MIDPLVEQQMQVLDIQEIKIISGAYGKPGMLLYITLALANGSTKTFHMMEANHAYQWLLQNKLEVIEAWRTRTGITSF
jgi:hypothetical protein